MGNYSVYIHRNKKDGKQYVGITCSRPERRWRKGEGYCGNKYFYNAIKKYGWNGFEHTILFEKISRNEAEKIEIALIAKYDLTNSQNGYNLRPGGKVCSPTEESKAKTSASLKGKFAGEKHPLYGKTGELSPTYGRKHTEEEREKMRYAQAGKWVGNKNPRYGKHCSEETREKIRSALVGKMSGELNPMHGKLGANHPASKRVVNINTGMEFDSIRAAASYFGIQESDISKCCSGKRCFAGKDKRTGEKLFWKREAAEMKVS